MGEEEEKHEAEEGQIRLMQKDTERKKRN